ncbi:conserved hypothetical protein [uncultured delta proteobacterium]|uniref:Alpha/beta hydrolase fold-3 domain-containing protein n=1 Tax=uncultured delta proteobacterium TaxID=34034 RepID=A0A212KBS3_9DELT|nr:conserved hypothetical protein [uncultured delta proteobacterium]
MIEIQRIRLWNPDKKNAMARADADALIAETPEPELHVFPATGANTGIAAVICPGGGYGVLALGSEGHCCAAYLASIGITGMVLQYRLPAGDKTVPTGDIRQAMAYARAHAGEWGVDPDKLGVIGFSAGGHLAAYASSVYADTPVSTRPDFTVLFYPVISMEKRKRGMTRVNLLGRHPTERDIEEFSCHLKVHEKTPPALLFLCDDDPLVPPRHGVSYYEALKRHGIAASLHIFPEGGHAWGFRGTNPEGVPFRYGREVRSLIGDWIVRVMGETPPPEK